jgi:hypothetical protein
MAGSLSATGILAGCCRLMFSFQLRCFGCAAYYGTLEPIGNNLDMQKAIAKIQALISTVPPAAAGDGIPDP